MTSEQFRLRNRGRILARLRGRCLSQTALAKELRLSLKTVERLCAELQRDSKVMVIENGNLRESSV